MKEQIIITYDNAQYCKTVINETIKDIEELESYYITKHQELLDKYKVTSELFETINHNTKKTRTIYKYT